MDGDGHYTEAEAVAMLRDALLASPASADALAVAAETAVPGDIDDDMAILVFRSSPDDLASFERSFPAEPIMVSEARRLSKTNYAARDINGYCLGCADYYLRAARRARCERQDKGPTRRAVGEAYRCAVIPVAGHCVQPPAVRGNLSINGGVVYDRYEDAFIEPKASAASAHCYAYGCGGACNTEQFISIRHRLRDSRCPVDNWYNDAFLNIAYITHCQTVVSARASYGEQFDCPRYCLH